MKRRLQHAWFIAGWWIGKRLPQSVRRAVLLDAAIQAVRYSPSRTLELVTYHEMALVTDDSYALAWHAMTGE